MARADQPWVEAPPRQLIAKQKQKFITIDFVIREKEIFVPKETFLQPIDESNTNIFSSFIQKHLEDLGNRENSIWRNYELGDNFQCDYLNCETISIGHYYVKTELEAPFATFYLPKKGKIVNL